MIPGGQSEEGYEGVHDVQVVRVLNGVIKGCDSFVHFVVNLKLKTLDFLLSNRIK